MEAAGRGEELLTQEHVVFWLPREGKREETAVLCAQTVGLHCQIHWQVIHHLF